MRIELLCLTENEDGSADCELEIDEEGKLYLINLGFNALMMKCIENYKAENEEKK